MKTLNKTGFSLLELMIVLAVTGIVSTIAAPNFMHSMAERRLNGAARMVLSDLMAARQKAVSHNHAFRVFFSASNHQYTILDDDDNDGDADTGEATQVRDIQTDYYDVTLSASANPVFTPRGTSVNGTKVTLNSSMAGVSKYVKVAWTGRVKIDNSP